MAHAPTYCRYTMLRKNVSTIAGRMNYILRKQELLNAGWREHEMSEVVDDDGKVNTILTKTDSTTSLTYVIAAQDTGSFTLDSVENLEIVLDNAKARKAAITALKNYGLANYHITSFYRVNNTLVLTLCHFSNEPFPD